jgi:hypothetical protein
LGARGRGFESRLPDQPDVPFPVTLAEVSLRAAPAPRRRPIIPAMRFTVLLRVEDSGSWPVLLKGDEKPEGDEHSRFRFVATIDDKAVADRVVELVQARCLQESLHAACEDAGLEDAMAGAAY